jgi:hypothetical protein
MASDILMVNKETEKNQEQDDGDLNLGTVPGISMERVTETMRDLAQNFRSQGWYLKKDSEEYERKVLLNLP